MAEAKKCPARLRAGPVLSSEQPEPRSPLSTRGANSTSQGQEDSQAVAQGPHWASCSGSLQFAQKPRWTPEEDRDPGNREVPPGSEANCSLAPSLGGQGSPDFQGTSSSGKLTVRLCHHALWRQFSQQQNEMVLTKQGRAMFPFLVYKIHGMDPSALYRVSVEVTSLDKYHWRYELGRWRPYEKEEEEEDNSPGKRFYEHPHSPNTGAHWMDREISFRKLKLTNQNTACQEGSQAPIFLKSRHKYQPRLLIEEVRHGKEQALASSPRHTFSFPDTDFIAVTAYLNAGLTRLKIENNPFATRHRRAASRPGPSLKKAPAAGQCTESTTSPASGLPSTCPVQVQEGPGQDKDCHLMRASPPPSGHLQDSRDSTSATSLPLPLTSEGLIPETLPRVLPSAGHWPPSPSTCTSSDNSMDCLWPENPKRQQAGPPGTEEEERLQEPLCQATSRSLSDISNLGQRTSKKTCLSPVESGNDVSDSPWETWEQEEACLGASESHGNSSQEAASEASSCPVVLQEGPAQTKENMISSPGNSIQETQPLSELPGDLIDLDLHSLLPQLVPAISPPAMPNDPSPDILMTQGNWPLSPSSCNSNVNPMQSFPSVNPKLQQRSIGTEEEERLQDQLHSSSCSIPSDIPNLDISDMDSLASALTNWTQEDEWLLRGHEVIGCRSQEAVSHSSSSPEGLLDVTAQVNGEMLLNPWDSFQVSQQPSEFHCHANALDLEAVDPPFLPSTSLSIQPHDPSLDTHTPQGHWAPPPSSCNSNVNTMQCFQSVNPKPQQRSIGTEEEERLQDQLHSSSCSIPSDIPNLDISDMDSLASALTNWTQEDEWLLRGNEVIGCSSQAAVSDSSSSPAGLLDVTAQVNGEMLFNSWDSFWGSQTPSEFHFHANALDLDAVDPQFLPSTSLPPEPYAHGPNIPITQGNSWPPSPSSCTSNRNTMECFQSVNPTPQQGRCRTEQEEKLQDQLSPTSSRTLSNVPHLGQRASKKRCLSTVEAEEDSLASAWTNWTQEFEWLLGNEVIGCSSQEAVSEVSYSPAGMQDDTAQVSGEMVLNPWHSFQVMQPPSEFAFNSTALDLDAVDHHFFPSTSLPTEPCGPSPDIAITPANWPHSPSNCTLNGNSGPWVWPGGPKPQQGSNGTEEEERLQEQLCPSSSSSPSDVSHLEQRASKKRCLSPVDSAQHFLAPAGQAKEQEDPCLIASKSSGNSSQEALSQVFSYPVILQEDTGQANGKENPIPGDSTLEAQTPSELSFDSDLCDVIHQFFPSTSPPAMPDHTSTDMPISQESWLPALSPCTSSNGNHMNCFQAGSPKSQQADPWMEVLERLEEQLCPSSSSYPAEFSNLC